MGQTFFVCVDGKEQKYPMLMDAKNVTGTKRRSFVCVWSVFEKAEKTKDTLSPDGVVAV